MLFDNGIGNGYLGKPYDTATGLYNYGYRDYAPTVARFTTVDPIRDGNNWFAYVRNDPVNYVDLWGLSASDKKTDWGKEISDIFSIQFGIQVTAGVNIPNVVSLEVSLNAASVNFSGEKNSITSGISVTGSVGNANVPIVSGNVSYEKTVEQTGAQIVFDLNATDYELNTELKTNSDYTVTVPTNFGLSVEINFSELVDIANKALEEIKNVFK